MHIGKEIPINIFSSRIDLLLLLLPLHSVRVARLPNPENATESLKKLNLSGPNIKFRRVSFLSEVATLH